MLTEKELIAIAWVRSLSPDEQQELEKLLDDCLTAHCLSQVNERLQGISIKPVPNSVDEFPL